MADPKPPVTPPAEQKKRGRKAGRRVVDPNETADAKFRRLANHRVPRVLKLLVAIGNLSANSQYHYTTEQVDKMFGLIHEGIRTARARFEGSKTTVQESIF